MTFEIDRTTVSEGGIVEVTWDCTGAERVELTIDNGYRTSVIPLPTGGAKRFRLNRSKRRTRLTITAWIGGKDYSKTIKVRVEEIPTARTETVDSQGRVLHEIDGWWRTIKERIRASTARMRYNYNALPPRKRSAVRTLALLAAGMLLLMAVPHLFLLGVAALTVYLLWVIWKR